MKQCCVPGCYNTFNLHRLPFSCPDRWKVWLDICPFLSRYSHTSLENVRICRIHFRTEHISDKLRLTSDAIPSRHLPSSMSSVKKPPEVSHPSFNIKYLEISPLLPKDDLHIRVVNDIPQESSALNKIPLEGLLHSTVSTSTDVGHPSLPTQTPVDSVQSLDIFHEGDMPLEPHINVIQYSQPSPDSFNAMLLDDQNIINTSEDLPQVCKETCGKSSILSSKSVIHPSPSIQPHETAFDFPHKEDLIEPIVNDVQMHNLQQSPTPSETMPSNIGSSTVPKTSHKRQKTSRSQKIPRVRLDNNDLSPRKRKLRKGNQILRARLTMLTNKYKKLKSKFNSISYKYKMFIKKYSLLSKFGKLLVDSQLRLSGTKSKGVRYTVDEKVFALSLYKLSPKCYRFLQKCNVRLPAKSTIGSILTNVPLRPGINDFIFQHLADAAKHKNTLGLQCVLLFDEVAINKNLFFNFHSGVIEGFEDLGGGERTHNVADKALVFMLRGIFSPWKIPIAFYFVRDGIKTFSLKNILKEIITEVFKSGFILRSTVSDQGSANVAAINSLISDTRENILRSGSNNDPYNIIHYKINGKKVYHMYDVPHLLKCLRNNFQKKNLLIGNKRAQWEYVLRVYELDGAHGLARATKLTDKHVKPNSYDKMKVVYAAQVFSRQVSLLLNNQMKIYENLRRLHNYSVPLVNIDDGFFTAEILLFFNNLFDSLNCTGHSGGSLQNALSLNSNHLDFWNEALKKLESMKFDASDSRESKPLTLHNFIHDIKTVKHLWSDLRLIPEVKFLSLKRLNQDPLENFFGQIRGQGGCNTHPDCHQFVALYKTLLINDISTGKSLYTNCTSDDDKMLGTLKNLVTNRKHNVDSIDHSSDAQNFIFIEECIPSENIFQTHSVAYIAGAVCRYLFPRLNCSQCQNCKNALLSNVIEPFHSLISIKEYDSTNRKLYYPSDKLSTLVWRCIYIIDHILPTLCKVYIYSELFKQFEDLDTSWYTCNDHKTNFLKAFWLFVIRMQVRQWCVNFNRRIHNVDSREKGAGMENLIATKVTKGASYRSVRRQSC